MSVLQELQNFTYFSRYARYNPQKKRRDSWKEAVDRVKNMMLEKYKIYPDVYPDIEFAYDLMYQKKVLGSQRALQFGGEPALKKNARIFNCAGTYIDRPRVFQEILWMLLCGVGMGYSVRKCHIDKLPEFKKKEKTNYKVFTIPDTIEGWSDALGILISNYLGSFQPEFDKYDPSECGRARFDYSNIRPKGSLLSSGVGKAPGPDGLRNSLEKIRVVLDKCLELGQKKLKPINAHDIICHAADCVLSGGIRRSALLCLFDPNDQEMISCKTGDWFINNPQRGRANNSAGLIRNKTTFEDFCEYIEFTKCYGEPGFIWCDSDEACYNPCLPSSAKLMTKAGIRQLADVQIGDEIWSETGWTKILNKWSTGIKKVIEYKTTFGSLQCTENHRIVSNGQKIIAKNTDSIDILRGPGTQVVNHNSQDVIDGLMVGDGTKHRASNNLMLLVIGKNDQDYFNSEISSHILQHRPGIKEGCYEVNTTLIPSELPLTYNRCIPARFLYGDQNKAASFLRGLYTANGSICGDRVTLKAASLKIIKQVQLMLSSLGIASYYTTNKENKVKFSNGTYTCKKSYNLNITRDIGEFYSNIGFIQKYKNEKLGNLVVKKKKKNYENLAKNIVETQVICEEEVFDITVDNVPHTFWCNGFNISNCVEVGFYCYNSKMQSGIQVCNLSTINSGNVKDLEDFLERVRAATIIGTLQAGFTDFSYLGPVSKEIIEREALLGVSMTGVMDNPDLVLDPKIQKRCAEYAKEINKEIAGKIKINQAARVTCLKPEGTTSCMLGTSSGIHPHHAKRYLRRVQVNRDESVYKLFHKHNQAACAKSVWSANDTDDVISFPIEVKDGSKLKNQISAVDLLKIVKDTQINWVDNGKNLNLCTQTWLKHNVSNTVVVHDHEWDEVAKFIYDNREYFCGISLLAASGDKDYAQAPFTTVFTANEIVKEYGDAALWCSGLIELAFQSFGDLWRACDAVNNIGYNKEEEIEKSTKIHCQLKSGKKGNKFLSNYELAKLWEDQRKIDEKLNFIYAVGKFADKYMKGDIKRLSYCMKDVFNWKYYNDLLREFQHVPYEEMTEEEDNTNFEAESSCVGGSCTI